MAAQPGLLQRGLNNLRNNTRLRESGTDRAEGKAAEGKGAAKAGKSARKGVSKAKGGLKNLRVHLGFSGIDAYDEDYEDQRRRRRARQVINPDDEEAVFTPMSGPNRDINENVAPEFRAQVAAGFVEGYSHTSGSTIIAGEDGDDDEADSNDTW